MKIRDGFVSNSSSASFIIEIESALSRKKIEQELLKAIASQCDSFFENKLEVKDGEHYLLFKDKLKYLKEDVVAKKWHLFNLFKQSDNTYQISFWTCMYNDIESFGDVCSPLLMLLTTNHFDDIKFVKSYIEED